jgi:cobalt-zinc-cadmium efflux system outer membrane protein
MSLLRVGALIAVLAACAPTRSEVFGPVDAAIQRRLGTPASWSDAPRTDAAITERLKQPLDLDAAIRIALARNRGLQARYEELGIARAEIAEATVLPPLEIDLSYKIALEGDGNELEIDAIQDVLSLLQVGQRRGVARNLLESARAHAIAATMELAARVELALYDQIAAQQELELRQTAFDAADAAAELIERMHAAGNTTDLRLASERGHREQARTELGRARIEVAVRREAMNKVLGLDGTEAAWTVAGRLPELPATAPALDGLEQEAIDTSLELTALRAEAEARGGEVGLARVRSWLPRLGLGAAASRHDGGHWAVGPAVSIGLPLFDQGQGMRTRATASLRRVQHELADRTLAIRAEARAARQRALGAHAEARQLQDVVLPLRQRVLDETVLQYNAMNASTFELLAARRELVDAGHEYVGALHRYWTAHARITAIRRGAMADHPVPAED